MSRNISKIYTVIGVLAVVILVAVFYVWYIRSQNSKQSESLVLQARGLADQGQCTQAVSAGNQAVASASTPTDVAAARYTLAIALLCRGQGSDTQDGIVLFKGLAADTTLSPMTRALAYNRLGGLFYNILGSQSNSTLVFNTPPYSDYLSQAGGDVIAATLHIFQVSEQLYPTPAAAYQNAVLEATQLHLQNFDAKDPAQIKLATDIQQEISTGDTLIRNAGGISSLSAPNLIWQFYVPRAIALATAADYIPAISSSMVNMAFDQAVASLAAGGLSTPTQQAQMLALRLSYAIVLSTQQAPKEKISSTLADFTFKPGVYPKIDRLILAIYSRPSKNLALQQLPKLAAVAPGFGAYLKELQSAQ